MDLGSLCALWCCLSIEVVGTLSNVIGYGTTILLANAWLSLLPCDVFLPEMLSIFVSYGDEIFGHHLFDYVSI